MEGLGPSGKDVATVGGRYPGVGNVLLGSGTSGSDDLVRVVVHVGGDDKDGGVNPCSITKVHHREEGVEKYRQDMGDTVGQRGVEG